MSVACCPECGASLPHAAHAGLCAACALCGALDVGEPGPVAPGQRIDDYELLDEIARGGMGVVFRARQVTLDRIVAIKVLLPGLSGPEILQRFRTEASAAAGLRHPHIVAVHDVGAWEGQPYLVMDHVEGRSLAHQAKVAARDTCDAVQIARWMKAIAEAVQHAHDHGILHRDLKPSNVLIDERGEPRVTDFGLAKQLAHRSQLTLSGQALGSPSYMPPEQTQSGGGKVSRRSDVYGLGATLYHLLTGRAPFQGSTPTDVLHQVLTCAPAEPRAINPAVPRDLETICLKCLEKDPVRRYASAQAVADDLGRFLEGQSIDARRAGALERLLRWCQRKPLIAVLGAVLAVSVGLAAWFGWQARATSQQLAHERVQRAIDAALEAGWGGDLAAAEQAIAQAQHSGASPEWVRILNGQLALYSLRTDEAIAEFEQAAILAPRSVAAKALLANAYLWKGELDRYSAMSQQLDTLAPETPEDHLFLGSALIMGHPDTSKAVSLLEVAKQKRPSGITFLLLGMAEGFRALDTGSWPAAQRAIDHCEWGTELLGPARHELLAPALSAFNAALRLCPEQERSRVLEKADRAARALEASTTPYGHIQRAFYFENTGDLDAESVEWQRVARLNRIGLSASWYAAAMLQRGRSAEALDTLGPAGAPTDPVGAVARAYLLVDLRRSNEAAMLYEQAVEQQKASPTLPESILLLAGQRQRVLNHSATRLAAIAPGHPDHQVLRYWAGLASAEDLLTSAGPSRVAQCRAHYFVGLSRLAEGDREAARAHFGRCAETGLQPVSEYQWSRAFLARLEQDERWPGGRE